MWCRRAEEDDEDFFRRGVEDTEAECGGADGDGDRCFALDAGEAGGGMDGEAASFADAEAGAANCLVGDRLAGEAGSERVGELR